MYCEMRAVTILIDKDHSNKVQGRLDCIRHSRHPDALWFEEFYESDDAVPLEQDQALHAMQCALLEVVEASGAPMWKNGSSTSWRQGTQESLRKLPAARRRRYLALLGSAGPWQLARQIFRDTPRGRYPEHLMRRLAAQLLRDNPAKHGVRLAAEACGALRDYSFLRAILTAHRDARSGQHFVIPVGRAHAYRLRALLHRHARPAVRAVVKLPGRCTAAQ